jgi:hypothetical protein
MKLKKCLFLALFTSNAAFADYGISLIKFTCIPELGFFKIDFDTVDGAAATAGVKSDAKSQQEWRKLWEAKGLYFPQNLTYECEFKQNIYTVTTSQPEPHGGRCGAQPPVSLTLQENGTEIFENISFGPNCSGEPTTISINVSNPPVGWGSRDISALIESQPDRKIIYLALGDDMTKVNINQNEITNYFSKFSQ